MAGDRAILIVQFIGRKGSFKTTFMTALGDMANYHGVKVLANYPIIYKKKEVERAELVDVLETPDMIMGSMYLWDEAYADVDSARHRSIGNLDMSYFNFQHRKSKFDLILTYIHFTSVDPRLRDEADLTILCEAVPPLGKPDLAVFRFCLPPAIQLETSKNMFNFDVIRTVMTYADDWAPMWKCFDTYWKRPVKEICEQRLRYEEKRKLEKEILVKKIREELKAEMMAKA